MWTLGIGSSSTRFTACANWILISMRKLVVTRERERVAERSAYHSCRKSLFLRRKCQDVYLSSFWYISNDDGWWHGDWRSVWVDLTVCNILSDDALERTGIVLLILMCHTDTDSFCKWKRQPLIYHDLRKQRHSSLWQACSFSIHWYNQPFGVTTCKLHRSW